MIPKDISDMVKELEDASDMLCDELGEWWSELAGMYSSIYGNCSSKEFAFAWENEIRLEHERLKSEFVMVEEKEPVEVRTYKVLRHISEIEQ